MLPPAAGPAGHGRPTAASASGLSACRGGCDCGCASLSPIAGPMSTAGTTGASTSPRPLGSMCRWTGGRGQYPSLYEGALDAGASWTRGDISNGRSSLAAGWCSSCPEPSLAWSWVRSWAPPLSQRPQSAQLAHCLLLLWAGASTAGPTAVVIVTPRSGRAIRAATDEDPYQQRPDLHHQPVQLSVESSPTNALNHDMSPPTTSHRRAGRTDGKPWGRGTGCRPFGGSRPIPAEISAANRA